MEVKVGEIFRVGRKIGAGSFGEIYLGTNMQTHEEIAIKLEQVKTKFPQLQWESKVCKILQGGVGIPKLHWSGKDGDYNVMIIDLLGHSLEDLFVMCGRKLSMKTVLMIAEQIISRIEYIHAKNFIYRDIKPDNFLIGTHKKADHIFLIDYGLAKRFRDPKTGQHIEYKDSKPFVGTYRYASINAHNGIESSRRDDLEAIGYVLMYFLRGSLPWQGIKGDNRKDKYNRIAEVKQQTSVEDLCKGYPQEFADFIRYTRNLKFEEKPDYNWIKGQFRNLLYRMEFTIDFIFDWTKLNSSAIMKIKENEKNNANNNNNEGSSNKPSPDDNNGEDQSLDDSPHLEQSEKKQRLVGGGAQVKSKTTANTPNNNNNLANSGSKVAINSSRFPSTPQNVSISKIGSGTKPGIGGSHTMLDSNQPSSYHRISNFTTSMTGKIGTSSLQKNPVKPVEQQAQSQINTMTTAHPSIAKLPATTHNTRFNNNGASSTNLNTAAIRQNIKPLGHITQKAVINK